MNMKIKAAFRKALLITVLMIAVFLPSFHAFAAATDEILNFTVTVDVNEDASLEMLYHIEWKVLDDEAYGPLEWIDLGVPNSSHENIRANCICPSTVNTPMLAERLKDPAFKAERLGEVPLGRFATAEDVAYSVLYLASEEASFINGVALPVDGGSVCD